MESYNTMLIGTFFAYPSFQKRFGKSRSTIPEAWTRDGSGS
jgi:hypothetical protein